MLPECSRLQKTLNTKCPSCSLFRPASSLPPVHHCRKTLGSCPSPIFPIRSPVWSTFGGRHVKNGFPTDDLLLLRPAQTKQLGLEDRCKLPLIHYLEPKPHSSYPRLPSALRASRAKEPSRACPVVLVEGLEPDLRDSAFTRVHPKAEEEKWKVWLSPCS